MSDKDENFVDVFADTTASENQRVDNLEKEVKQENQQDDIPEKFRGKDIKEVIKAHQELEKVLGRQGQEVGELRSVIDTYIKNPQNTNVEKVDQNTNKSDSLDPEVKQGLRKIRRMETDMALKDAHGDYTEIIKDPDFMEWVGGSKVRTKLFIEADKEYDFDAANELFTTWKERKTLLGTAKVNEEEDEKRQADLKAAKTGGSGGSEGGSKKIYRRADLIRLRQTNPRKYAAMDQEIQDAYREGRVK